MLHKGSMEHGVSDDNNSVLVLSSSTAGVYRETEAMPIAMW